MSRADEEILALAEELDADLLVVGSRGHGPEGSFGTDRRCDGHKPCRQHLRVLWGQERGGAIGKRQEGQSSGGGEDAPPPQHG